MSSPNSRTKSEIEKLGGVTAVVEQRLPIPGKHVSKDMFGFGDMIALVPDMPIICIQITAGGNGSARVKKIRDDDHWHLAERWLNSGGEIQVWDWREKTHKFKNGNKTKRKVARVCRIVDRHSKVEWTDEISSVMRSFESDTIPRHLPDGPEYHLFAL